MAYQWQKSQWEVRRLRWCHPSANTGTVYPEVVVVNSITKMLCRMGEIQGALVQPHPPLIAHNLQRRVYNFCTRSAMLLASETWAPTSSDLHHLQFNGWTVVHWMHGVTTKDLVSSQDPVKKMQLGDLAKVLCTHRLRWHDHVEYGDGWLKKVTEPDPIGGRGCGLPRKTRSEVIFLDRLAFGLTETYLHQKGSKWNTYKIRQTGLDPPLY